ncbi:MAG: carbohydrate-binding module family 20 domain-containing protein [Motilibacteraceae bacterium]
MRTRLLVLLSLLAALLPVQGALSRTPAAAAPSGSRTVIAQLFEWPFADVGRECTQFLGPAGYGAVQVSPPQEHVVLPGSGYPWWQQYQPVSYQIAGRLGNRQQFADMVSACHAAGVKVYADAVVNHMTGQDNGGTGSGGTQFQHYTYPGSYQSWDFHHCGRNGNDDIVNYNDRWEVQNCELVNLADLATDTDYVRGKIAGYLNDLLSLGVDGFRVDGAKHIPEADIANIVSRLSRPAYVYQEVIYGAGEPITPDEYEPSGDVLEFRYGTQLGSTFKTGQLSWLSNFGESWGFLPGGKAVVFTDNHDTQRSQASTVLTYKDGQLYRLGNAFELAWPYGTPKVMSSYAFTSSDQGPPSSGNDAINPVTCFSGGWVCEHRYREIANMVAFHNATQGTAVTNWWSDGSNQIAFGRGDKGYVVINREGGALTRTFQTSLPAGTYCDVQHGDFANGTCSGPTYTVDASGKFTATVQGMQALALHAAAKVAAGSTSSSRVSTSFAVYATTTYGQNVYVVGDVPALGGWDLTKAVPLSAAGYPTWTGTVSLPAGTAFQYKYVKKNTDGSWTWECCSNRTATVPSSGTLTLNDTWRS